MGMWLRWIWCDSASKILDMLDNVDVLVVLIDKILNNHLLRSMHYTMKRFCHERLPKPSTHSSGPSINSLIPSPFFTCANALSASSNLTLPVMSSLTEMRPASTRSTAVW